MLGLCGVVVLIGVGDVVVLVVLAVLVVSVVGSVTLWCFVLFCGV